MSPRSEPDPRSDRVLNAMRGLALSREGLERQGRLLDRREREYVALARVLRVPWRTIADALGQPHNTVRAKYLKDDDRKRDG